MASVADITHPHLALGPPAFRGAPAPAGDQVPIFLPASAEAFRSDCPRSLPIATLARVADRVSLFHKVPLSTMIARGGLDPREILALFNGRRLRLGGSETMHDGIALVQALARGETPPVAPLHVEAPPAAPDPIVPLVPPEQRAVAPALFTVIQAAARAEIGTCRLRMWEERYGWPKPTRTGAGSHRRYPLYLVEQIRRVAELAAAGWPLKTLIQNGLPCFPPTGALPPPRAPSPRPVRPESRSRVPATSRPRKRQHIVDAYHAALLALGPCRTSALAERLGKGVNGVTKWLLNHAHLVEAHVTRGVRSWRWRGDERPWPERDRPPALAIQAPFKPAPPPDPTYAAAYSKVAGSYHDALRALGPTTAPAIATHRGRSPLSVLTWLTGHPDLVQRWRVTGYQSYYRWRGDQRPWPTLGTAAQAPRGLPQAPQGTAQALQGPHGALEPAEAPVATPDTGDHLSALIARPGAAVAATRSPAPWVVDGRPPKTPGGVGVFRRHDHLGHSAYRRA
jgi:hypothetical protein